MTDDVRLCALYHEGGIYMDTDVELLKNIDDTVCIHHFNSSWMAEEKRQAKINRKNMPCLTLYIFRIEL